MLGILQLRIIALLSTGALAVHELRYLAAYGGAAETALQQQGHAYLNTLTPLIGVVLACLLGHLLYRLAWGRERQRRRSPSPAAAAVAFGAGLLAVYTGQELLEGLLSSGHPGGLHGVFGHGGWLAVPLSAGIGLGLSLFVRCARAAVGRARTAVRLTAPRAGGPVIAQLAAAVVVAGAPALARHLAGRAPPLCLA